MSYLSLTVYISVVKHKNRKFYNIHKQVYSNIVDGVVPWT